MKPVVLFFFGALLASGVWFYCFGKGRAQTVGQQQTDPTDQVFFVLMAGGMSALGEVVIRAYAPVRHLRAKSRLLKHWIKEEKRSVTQNQQGIISVEKQAFWITHMTARMVAAYRIARDHVMAKRSPSRS